MNDIIREGNSQLTRSCWGHDWPSGTIPGRWMVDLPPQTSPKIPGHMAEKKTGDSKWWAGSHTCLPWAPSTGYYIHIPRQTHYITHQTLFVLVQNIVQGDTHRNPIRIWYKVTMDCSDCSSLKRTEEEHTQESRLPVHSPSLDRVRPGHAWPCPGYIAKDPAGQVKTEKTWAWLKGFKARDPPSLVEPHTRNPHTHLNH